MNWLFSFFLLLCKCSSTNWKKSEIIKEKAITIVLRSQEKPLISILISEKYTLLQPTFSVNKRSLIPAQQLGFEQVYIFPQTYLFPFISHPSHHSQQPKTTKKTSVHAEGFQLRGLLRLSLCSRFIRRYERYYSRDIFTCIDPQTSVLFAVEAAGEARA